MNSLRNARPWIQNTLLRLYFKIPVGPVQLVPSDNEVLLRFWFVTITWLFDIVLEILWTENI